MVDPEAFCVAEKAICMYMDGFHMNGPEYGCIMLFFRAWTLDTPVKFVFGCIGCVLLGILTQAIVKLKSSKVVKNIESDGVREWVGVGLYGLNMYLAYMVMLAVMTYNVEIFFCTLAGIIIGYAIFLRKKSGSDTTLCCQEPDVGPSTAPTTAGLPAERAPGNVRSTIHVEGMVCNACVRTVTNHLNSLPGVAGCEVSLENKQAVVEHNDNYTARTLAQEIDDIGFDASIAANSSV